MYPDERQLSDLLALANSLCPAANLQVSLLGKLSNDDPHLALISALQPQFLATGSRRDIGNFVEGLIFALRLARAS